MSFETRPGDWVILLCCLLLIPLSWSLTRQQPGMPTTIEIMVENKAPVFYPINTNRRINIASKLGESVIEIHEGKVRFLNSPCNGKICVLSGWHQHSGDHIACLPNKISVSLLSQQERFDGINF
jgi:hypothetical protein